MIIKYGDNEILRKREKLAEKIFKELPYRYCFITGSFIYKERYEDIDLFVITRSKKKVKIKNKKINIQILDFNDLHSLFYHSISKSCIAKNILPKKSLKTTISNYWNTLNQTVPTILNEKNNFKKHLRDLILHTVYFKKKVILNSKELNKKIDEFSDIKEVMRYIEKEVPKIIKNNSKLSYIKRFLYTESGNYKDLLQYDSHRFLYKLSHYIIKGAS